MDLNLRYAPPISTFRGMTKTRNNHYVPKWYQKGFLEPGKTTLDYLDLAPHSFLRGDGSVAFEHGLRNAPPSRAFVQRDLYSTHFGTSVNDEIERKMFGDIDSKGARAIRAFSAGDPNECHRNFENLFEYIDIQKLRTPKGLAWLKAQYPTLTQNELMMEMQAIRMMHCTIWTEGVREIVSAEGSKVKFIFSDHPVTVYNAATPPASKVCNYPSEPGIELKGTHTVFPLDRDHCLIFTNLEYAEDPTADPLQKRTFARRFRSSMVRTDAFIRTRKLSTGEVGQINRVIRSRARKYVAAGQNEWLPEPVTKVSDWKELGQVLLPPSGELFEFGGKIIAKFDDGHVHYQDEFGRTEEEREFLKKEPTEEQLRPRDPCGCGSGKKFGACCKKKTVPLRPAWDQLSIRERNLALLRGIENVLDLRSDRDWTAVRRTMTDEKISEIYSIYEALWPLETDLLSLLPKPDGTARAVYTGVLEPSNIVETSLGSSLLFGEVLMQHPFVNPGAMSDEYNPVKNPQKYRQDFLKTILLFMQVMPLVEVGLINLFPDPWDFDNHLRDQTMQLAKERSSFMGPLMATDAGMMALAKENYKRSLYLLSDDGQRANINRTSPELNDDEIENMIGAIKMLRDDDPLAVLQEGASLDGKDNGQLLMFKLAPNFEMAMYVAQATGSAIITDNPHRWKELLTPVFLRGRAPADHLTELANLIQASAFSLPQNSIEIADWWVEGRPQPHTEVFRNAFKYLERIDTKGTKPNYEQSLKAQFEKAQKEFEKAIRNADLLRRTARIRCAFPSGGIYDSTITRLLLMSSSEHHLPSVPMAFFLETLPD